MTIHLFIQLLYSTNIRTINTARSSLSVNARHASASFEVNRRVKRLTCCAFAAMKGAFCQGLFSSF